ncbi:hypothetical protein Phep_2075 [Pedobacter heparinus DSM 2366]|uniref:Uncharacterized protein n=1 Tax=Pedobacter heparinus (strain ATCC 13125 / DSM 2366 / CIP 104194 / JCM 7457 / NBRC 12017 / NCIMB 9290 / NRRL B-14731 / HIM 762-3) TaxID=485917 RepID=C6XWY6_PEDHD|nr:hypothetical protein Phep_2075 [Pedobacter heparinus DSM 2366]
MEQKGIYKALMATYNKSQLQAYALFKKFFRENYPLGFTFQTTSKDFII